jgi:hypothetical protein
VIGLVGAPFTFASVVFLYVTFLWARRMHGTLPLYLSKATVSVVRAVQSISFSPQRGSHITQVLFLVCVCVIAGLVPGIYQTAMFVPRLERTLGEALTFKLVTENCDIRFIGVDVRVTEPASIRAYITANGTLEDVVLTSDFCQEDQFVAVKNSRQQIERYTGYKCEIDILIPRDPAHSIPVMEIENSGSKVTRVTSLSPTQTINFGPNSLTISGSNVAIALYNLIARRFNVPHLQRGSIMLSNATFSGISINAEKPDVSISVSPENSMRVPFAIEYEQPNNAVCFVSGTSFEKPFTVDNRCDELCFNRSSEAVVGEENGVELRATVYDLDCQYICQRDSKARVIPNKLDPQPGLSDVAVKITTEGQVFFQGVPEQRVPPASGRIPLDPVVVYDGIRKTRTLGIPPPPPSCCPYPCPYCTLTPSLPSRHQGRRCGAARHGVPPGRCHAPKGGMVQPAARGPLAPARRLRVGRRPPLPRHGPLAAPRALPRPARPAAGASSSLALL